ncbi:hypothetical protein BS78_10G148700 [Paspalum vaginatum]|nr:hypothetical protein BS78_10G148700 [Paspalum vaginatum]
MNVLPTKEVAGSKSCKWEGAPTEDTHESVVFAPFFVRGLGLPICSFVRRLLNFYAIHLNHMNPNSIMEISIFIHLCEAFLGIVPHFGLWKYLHHCKPSTKDGVLQVVGGTNLELRRGRQSVYLDIPLKDNNRGWHAKWFIMENHGNSLPSYWEEAPTQGAAEADILLKEIADLKEKALNAQVVCDISKFLSDPPQQGGHQILKRKSKLSPQEMEAVVAATQGEGNNEAATFIVIQRSTQDEVTLPRADMKEDDAPKHDSADPTNPAPEHTNVAGEKPQAHPVPKRTHTKLGAVKPKPLPIKKISNERSTFNISWGALIDEEGGKEGGGEEEKKEKKKKEKEKEKEKKEKEKEKKEKEKKKKKKEKKKEEEEKKKKGRRRRRRRKRRRISPYRSLLRTPPEDLEGEGLLLLLLREVSRLLRRKEEEGGEE